MLLYVYVQLMIGHYETHKTFSITVNIFCVYIAYSSEYIVGASSSAFDMAF